MIRVVLNVVSALIFVLLASLLLARCIDWLKAFKAFGCPSLGSCWRMLQLDRMRTVSHLRHRPHALTTSAVGIAAAYWCITLWKSSQNFAPLAFAGALLMLAILRPLSRALPPCVLLLAGSRPEADGLLGRLYEQTHPLGVVSLIKPIDVRGPFEDGTPQEAWRRNLAYFGWYRLPDDVSWRAAVVDLMRIAPLVIIDARVSSANLIDEAALALTIIPHGKLFWIVEKNKTPVLDQVTSQIEARKELLSQAMGEKELIEFVASAARARVRLPPVCRFA